jgi:hypothetical protein
MNIRNDIRRMDQKIHRWEHNMALSSEKLVHQEAFWPLTVAALMVVALILLAMFAKGTTPTPRFFPGPYGPLY